MGTVSGPKGLSLTQTVAVGVAVLRGEEVHVHVVRTGLSNWTGVDIRGVVERGGVERREVEEEGDEEGEVSETAG